MREGCRPFVSTHAGTPGQPLSCLSRPSLLPVQTSNKKDHSPSSFAPCRVQAGSSLAHPHTHDTISWCRHAPATQQQACNAGHKCVDRTQTGSSAHMHVLTCQMQRAAVPRPQSPAAMWKQAVQVGGDSRAIWPSKCKVATVSVRLMMPQPSLPPMRLRHWRQANL
jgi:hypothetical protein